MKASNQATRVVASTLGILVGLAGIDHGIFEILQYQFTLTSILIAAIGPEQRFWVYGEETAITIIPSFLISGILSVILGIVVVIWAIGFIDRKYGALVLMLLAVISGFAYDIQAQIQSELKIHEG